MPLASRACPLCGTLLDPTKLTAVMRAHRGMEQQLDKLKAAEERARAAVARARARADRAMAAEKRRADDRVRKHQDATRKLRGKIEDLERRLKHGETAQSEGLLEEKALLGVLKNHFPCDLFD